MTKAHVVDHQDGVAAADELVRLPEQFSFQRGRRIRHRSQTRVIGGLEFSQAIATMPIGFIERSPGSYVPVAVVSLSKGGNLFVGPGGQWFGGYVPAVLRSYPFSLIRAEGSEQGVLGIDEDSGLVVDNPSGEGVERFFEADGTPAPATQSITELLHFVERDQITTDRAVSPLADAGVIKPWPLTVQVGEQQITVNGLHCIDEAALNARHPWSFRGAAHHVHPAASQGG